MYLFFHPRDEAFVMGILGSIICLIAFSCLLAGLIQVASEDSRERGKLTLVLSLMLLIIGIGICGAAG